MHTYIYIVVAHTGYLTTRPKRYMHGSEYIKKFSGFMFTAKTAVAVVANCHHVWDYCMILSVVCCATSQNPPYFFLVYHSVSLWLLIWYGSFWLKMLSYLKVSQCPSPSIRPWDWYLETFCWKFTLRIYYLTISRNTHLQCYFIVSCNLFLIYFYIAFFFKCQTIFFLLKMQIHLLFGLSLVRFLLAESRYSWVKHLKKYL